MNIGLVFFLVLVLSLMTSQLLKSKLKRYQNINLNSGLSGAEIAQKMLHDHNITHVHITSTVGIRDHYNSKTQIINLSEKIYHGKNIAAAAIASHECGHAIQQIQAYKPLKFRAAIVPIVDFSSRYVLWITVIGTFLMGLTPIPLLIGIILFVLNNLFSLLELPVEFNASKRALSWLSTSNVIVLQEEIMIKDALKWASMTYVMVSLTSLAELIRIFPIHPKKENE